MITGTTGESIIVSGDYQCQEHPEHQLAFQENDQFPSCTYKDQHPATWELYNYQKRETPKNGQPLNDLLREDPEAPDDTYKRKGFWAAMNSHATPAAAEHSLEFTLQVEHDIHRQQQEQIRLLQAERIEHIEKRIAILQARLEERIAIKSQYHTELTVMKSEYESISKEIADLNKTLREQIKEFGGAKEGLILKRLEAVSQEIDKGKEIFQKAENDLNGKFKANLEQLNFSEADKQYYYDYRQRLVDSLKDVQRRVRLLESHGLNNTITYFLIAIGWVAAFVGSWFFVEWIQKVNQKYESGSSNIAIYILDNLRNFVLLSTYQVSLGVFLGGILLFYFVTKFCHRQLVIEGFVADKRQRTKQGQSNKSDNQQNTTDPADRIDFSLEDGNLLRAQFRATGWYELWLKIAPFITVILLLIIVLAIGSTHGGEADKAKYESLSSSLSLQLVGFLIPLAGTGIFFLYITQVIEKKADAPDGSSSDGQHTGAVPPGKERIKWEMILAVLCFLGLTVIMMVLAANSSPAVEKQFTAWGFFISCLGTALALGYGYRYHSLTQTFYNLTLLIDHVNAVIRRLFYPDQVSFLTSNRSLNRVAALYASLLEMSYARNQIAVRMLLPDGTIAQGTSSAPAENNTGEDDDSGQANNVQPEEKLNAFQRFITGIREVFRRMQIRLAAKEQRIQELEKELAVLKQDHLDFDESTYFPEASAKVKEQRHLIEERTSRLKQLKEELDGYYQNKKTWASLQQQIENLNKELAALDKELETTKQAFLTKMEKLNFNWLQKSLLIQEGYTMGRWFSKEPKI